MGCNTSRGATVVDPSEKPEERPKTATSTKEVSTEETNGTTEKDKDEKTESSSWVPSLHLVVNSSQSKKHDKLPFLFIKSQLFTIYMKNVFPFYLSADYVLSLFSIPSMEQGYSTCP